MSADSLQLVTSTNHLEAVAVAAAAEAIGEIADDLPHVFDAAAAAADIGAEEDNNAPGTGTDAAVPFHVQDYS